MLQHLLFLRPSIEGVSVTTENLVFKLIYAITCPLFLAFGVIFYTRVCFTDPINCIANSTESFKVLRAIDSYCLENSYVIKESTFAPKLQDAESIQIDDEMDRLYQSNYQYTGLFFVICGALCYIPYVLWEWFENGLLKSLLQDLMSVLIHTGEDNRKKFREQINTLEGFWIRNKAMLETYAIANIFCECLNLVCIVFVFLLGNEFLYGNYITFGITTGQSHEFFPKLANCSWSTVGPCGKPVSYAGVCSMNMNYLSEKMFYCAWWWLAICMSLCIENLVYRYVLYRNADIRVWTITDGHLHNIGKLKGLGVTADSDQNSYTTHVPYLQQITFGEFFMLKRIQANVPPFTFDNILGALSLDFRSKTHKEE